MSITEIKLAIVAVLMLGSAALSGWVMHEIGMAKYRALELKIAEAHAEAQQLTIERQGAFDKLAAKQSELDIAKQAKISEQTQTSKAEVVRYVTQTKLCIPRAFMRLLDAAAGTGGDSLPHAAGEPVTACATVASVGRLIDNIGRFNGNREQLNDLSKSVIELNSVSQKMQPKAKR